MNVLVCGAGGCIGSAVVRGLRARGHRVIEGRRGGAEPMAPEPDVMPIDFMEPVSPATWARRLGARRIEAVVNAVGMLMPSRGQRYERVHTAGPIELFRGAASAGVRRVVQISALGVGTGADSLASPYLHSKLLADEALASLPLQWAVMRPWLVYGPGSRSAALFSALASLPVIGLPGRGEQRLQPLHVDELAQAIVRWLAGPPAAGLVYELGGGEVLTYRRMLAAYREALGRGAAWWMPVPMPLMAVGARLAEALPQKVFSRETLRLLRRGSVPAHNALPALLARAPLGFVPGVARP